MQGYGYHIILSLCRNYMSLHYSALYTCGTEPTYVYSSARNKDYKLVGRF